MSRRSPAAAAEQRGDAALRLGALVARGTVHSTKTPLYDEAMAEALAAEGLALARELGDRTAWQAREIIEHMASHAGSAELRESFLDTPAVRAVLAEDRGGWSVACA